MAVQSMTYIYATNVLCHMLQVQYKFSSTLWLNGHYCCFLPSNTLVVLQEPSGDLAVVSKK